MKLLEQKPLSKQIRLWFEFWMNNPCSFWLMYAVCIQPGMRECAEMIKAWGED